MHERLPVNRRLHMPDMDRPMIAVPPGLGDSYWSIVKLRAFCKREGLDRPYVGPIARPDRKFNGDVRTVPFLQRLPFLTSMDRSIDPGPDRAARTLLTEALSLVGRTVFRNVFGVDYLLSYNGMVANGKKLEEVDDLECEWFPEMTFSADQEAFRIKCRVTYGDYMALFWPFYGFYVNWLKEFSQHKIEESIIRLGKETGLRPVFVGARWDVELNRDLTGIISRVPNAVDLRGKTNLDEVFGLMQGAKIFIGHQAGLGMMGNILGTKTLLTWNRCINPDMPINCMPPSTIGKTYFVMDSSEMTVDNFVGKVKDILAL